MTAVPLHPALVHLPLGLAMVLPALAIALMISVWRGWLPRRAWLGFVGLQLLLVGSGFAALQTGEADEETVEKLVSHEAMEAHEHAAKRFMLGGGVTLALAAATLAVAWRKERSTWLLALMAASTVGSLAVATLAVATGSEGGELVYREGAANAWVPAAGAPVTAESDD